MADNCIKYRDFYLLWSGDAFYWNDKPEMPDDAEFANGSWAWPLPGTEILLMENMHDHYVKIVLDHGEEYALVGHPARDPQATLQRTY